MSAASWEVGFASLKAAAQNAHLQRHELQCVRDLQATLARCLTVVSRDLSEELSDTPVAAAAPEVDADTSFKAAATPSPQPHLPPSPEEPTEVAVAPTALFWRAWRTESSADTLFFRSGLSTSLVALDKITSDLIVRGLNPRLRRLQAKVDQLTLRATQAARCALIQQNSESDSVAWLVDTMELLSQAAEAPTELSFEATSANATCAVSHLWVSLDADLSGVAKSAMLEKEAKSISEERLRQQQQRLLHLLSEVQERVLNHSMPRCRKGALPPPSENV